MELKLACADFTFPLLPHHRSLELIAALEFSGVDIGLFEGRSHLWPSREFVDVTASARALRIKLQESGLRAADVFLQTNPDFVSYAINHLDLRRRSRARDWFLRTVEYAAHLGALHVTTLPGVYFPGESRAASWQRCCEELAWRVERARDAGCIFAIEAHLGSIAPRPREAARLVSKVPGLTLTLDYTHFIRAGLPQEAVEPLLPLASHFHVRGARKGRLQTSFAANVIDYARVLRSLQASGYHGFLGIEYVWTEWERCNEVDNLCETILFRDFLRQAASGLDAA